MDKRKVSSSQKIPLTAVSAYLEDLLAGFRAGNIIVGKGDESITLYPAEQVSVEIEAKHKKDKMSFSLELSWMTGGMDKCVSEEPLYITSAEREDNPLYAPLPSFCGKDPSQGETLTKNVSTAQPAKNGEKETKSALHGVDAKK